MLKIPEKLFEILKQDNRLLGAVMSSVSNFEQVLSETRLFFFEEYTDHGIKHIENVLTSCEWLIPDDTLSLLNANDIATLILSVLLHDIGMHTEFSTFKNLIEYKKYDDVTQAHFDSKDWADLWEEYLDEAKKFSSKQRKSIFGNEFKNFQKPKLEEKDDLTGSDKKLIGEFIRRHHPRLAHEIALKGIIGDEGNKIELAQELHPLVRNLSAVLARSHGIEIRDTYRYLQSIGAKAWKKPDQIHIIYLMVVLRIADFIQIDAKRVSEVSIKTKTFSSPISKLEHAKHLSIDFIQSDLDDPETLYVKASPLDSIVFVKLIELLKSIQYELDISWAILGEVYGKDSINLQPKIKYRRINSNLYESDIYLTNNINYVPEKINFQADDELPKLLIAPLYGNESTYGVRELVQNSIDACKEREFDENDTFIPLIEVIVNSDKEGNYFLIKDNGKGMTLFEIKNYFLKAGASLRKSLEWQKKYTDSEGRARIQRTGRFGIGVLAAFLLGDKIIIETKNKNDETGYKFEARVDTDQINVLKDNSLNIGTSIKIYLKEEAFLSIRDSSEDNTNSPLWYQWYTLKHPKIKYKIFKKEVSLGLHIIPNINKSIPKNWCGVDHAKFEKILWTYNNKHKKFPFSVNGIVVPNVHNALDVTDYSHEIVKQSPTILLFDNDGVLPLTLNRNDIDGKLPFKNEIIHDIYKDIISSLLCFRPKSYINNDRIDLKLEKFSHGSFGDHKNHFMSNLIYHQNGFTVKYSYFLNELKNSQLITLLVNDPVDISKDFTSSINSQYTFEIFYPNLSISYAKHWLDPIYFYNGKGIVSIPSNLYDTLFEKSKNKMTSSTKINHKIIKKDAIWVTYTNTYDKKAFEFTDEILSTSSKLSGITQSHVGNNISVRIFNDLLERYIEKNVLIPYDFDERKKLYPLAFSELESYMSKYIL